MKVVFISNYLNHHQKPFSDAMYQRLRDDYVFIETEPMSVERVQMGWSQSRTEYCFCAYESEKAKEKAIQMAFDADVMILGSAPDYYIEKRLKAGKLTFKYSERFYKQGLTLRRFPHAIAGAWLHHGRFQRYPLYMLCASAYTAADCAVFHNYIGRTYKWGYFPETKQYDINTLMGRKLSAQTEWKQPVVSILWAGRFIGWKHPDVSIEVAALLKEKGYSFKMSIIGNGEMEQQLCAMIREKKLEDCVEMLGAMTPEEVRSHMERADIYLFTSDFHEGWGAVLNESMNSGCAVVASYAIGSVPFLIEDGVNGLIYENGNLKDLLHKVQRLLENADYRKQLGRRAYQTVDSLWNANTAAERFITLANALLTGDGEVFRFENGPCSKAEILKNNWYISERNGAI